MAGGENGALTVAERRGRDNSHLQAPACAQDWPNPSSIDTTQDLIRALRRLKARSGLSYKALERRTGIPATTLADSLRLGRTTLPPLDRIHAILQATIDQPELDAWTNAWVRLDRGHIDTPPPDHAREVPHQLPRDRPHFIGREHELRLLDRLHHPRHSHVSPLVIVTGAVGIGKTALAVRWGHRNINRFPHGQLFLDLDGSNPKADPATTSASALRVALTAFGIPHHDIPPDVPSQQALYRTLTYPRAALIVLDDIADPRQPTPLLPAGPRTTTIITSRQPLPDLEARYGALSIALPPLTAQQSRRLIAAMIEDRPSMRTATCSTTLEPETTTTSRQP